MAWTAPRTWVSGETLTAALLNAQLRDNLGAAFPTGSLHFLVQAATSTVTDVNGMGLEGNGATPARTTYSSLNTLLSGLSYPFGSGDGSSTFTLPDLRGRELVAHPGASGHADVSTLGTTDGNSLATRSPKHSHTTSGMSTGATSAGTPSGSVSSVSAGTPSGSITITQGITNLGASGGANAFTTATPGGGGSATFDGTHSFTGNALGTHNHTFSGSALSTHTHTVSGTVGVSGRGTDTAGFVVGGIWWIKY